MPDVWPALQEEAPVAVQLIGDSEIVAGWFNCAVAVRDGWALKPEVKI